MSIAILCPTRDRARQFKRMLKSADDTISSSFVVFGGGDASDGSYSGFPLINMPENLPTAHKWNLLAETALHDRSIKLFMLGSDDMYFETTGWDKALLDHYNALENKIHVYALQDSRDPDGTPHPIVTREYIDALGYFVPPIFLHWYVDSWTVEIARANNCFTHLKEYSLIHDKPSDKGIIDETHNRIRQWGWNHRDRWVNEKCRHFLRLEQDRLKLKLHGIEYNGLEISFG